MVRTEQDLLGKRELPAAAPWGIHTLRASENFPPILGPVHTAMIRALIRVKRACARTNAELGFLDAERAAAIEAACVRLLADPPADAFPLDALQGGAGTSTHMNLNEVIANLALDHLGRRRGDYAGVDPFDHVNLHQSTNDVYPTALKIAALEAVRELGGVCAGFQGILQQREKDFAAWVIPGSTERVDAVPITLGAQFGSFAEAVARDRWRTVKCTERLRTVNLGGTAVGTGLAAPREYIFRVVEILREETGLALARGENLMDQTANTDAFVEVSGILKACACNLMKIADDLRLLSQREFIRLPAVQAGSSIMPGKVNPVLLEYAIQAGLKIQANDLLVADCASRGSLQICEFLPLLGHALLESLIILKGVIGCLTPFVGGITAQPERCRVALDHSLGLFAVWVPEVGYAQAGAWAAEYVAHPGGSVRDFLAHKLGADRVAEALTPERLTALGYVTAKKGGPS